jgi:hypothetical protein
LSFDSNAEGVALVDVDADGMQNINSVSSPVMLTDYSSIRRRYFITA